MSGSTVWLHVSWQVCSNVRHFCTFLLRCKTCKTISVVELCAPILIARKSEHNQIMNILCPLYSLWWLKLHISFSECLWVDVSISFAVISKCGWTACIVNNCFLSTVNCWWNCRLDVPTILSSTPFSWLVTKLFQVTYCAVKEASSGGKKMCTYF